MFRLHTAQFRQFRTHTLKINRRAVPPISYITIARCLSTYTTHVPICFNIKYEPPRYLYGITDYAHTRHLSTTAYRLEKEPPNKPSSKVESAVESIKKDIEEKEKNPKPVVKKSLKERIKDELMHYYHGFRLFGVELRISSGLLWRILKGETLTRREHRLLVTTIGDIIRMIPFIVFIVVPFMEFALPLFIKFFPGMLPSTFESKDQRDQKYRQHLKAKIEVAKFFQETLDEMAPQASDRHSEQAKEFAEFFARIRTSGDMATSDEIMKFSKLFEDEITLDSLQRPHLVALCRVLNASTIGTSAMLRFNLRMKLRSLSADDKMIAKEGVDSLNLQELQQACQARGMRAYGVSEERLRNELRNWLDLSMNEKVPQSLLLLSRAFMVPDNVPTSHKLKATISALPEQVVTQTKAAIGEKEGKVDFKTKIEAIKLEEAKIKEEKAELREAEEEKKLLDALKREKDESLLRDKVPVIDQMSTPELLDPAPIIKVDTPKPKSEEGLSAKDIEVIEDAIENIAQTKKSLLIEKEVIEDLKEGMSDYTEDVQQLQDIINTKKADVKVTKGAKRLYRAVNSMISKMDKVLQDLESKEQLLKSTIEQTRPDQVQEQLIHIDELMNSIKNLQKVPDEAKLKLIQDVLGRLDDDFDGQLKVDDVLKMVEMIGNEAVSLSEKQMNELIELLDKEEVLEVESKIQKALDKAAETEKKAQAENINKSLFDLIREAQERKSTMKADQKLSEPGPISDSSKIIKPDSKPEEKRPDN